MVRDVLTKQMSGTLRLHAHSDKLERGLSPVDLAPKGQDGVVRLGEAIMLLHIDSASVLSVSVDDVGRPTSVTGATGDLASPLARTTFFLEPYTAPKPSAYELGLEGDELRYGQKVRLVANALNRGAAADPASDPLYLFSRPQSAEFMAKYSKRQYVGLTRTRNYDSVWMVVAQDPDQRVVSEGLEVTAGAPIVLVHCQTNQALCMETDFRFATDFGVECEVSANTVVGKARPAGRTNS